MLPRPDALSGLGRHQGGRHRTRIAEGVAAGCVTVGVALSGNEAGLTVEQFNTLSPAEKAAVRERAGAKLKAAGAHHIIDTVADLPGLIDELQIDPGKATDVARKMAAR